MKRFVNSGAEIRVLMASPSTWTTARQSGHAEIDISAPCDPSPLVSSPFLNFLCVCECVCESNRICCCQSSAWPVCFQLPALHKETSLTPQLITSVLTERLHLQGRRKSAGDGDPAHLDLTFCGLVAALVFLPLSPRNRLYGFILTYPTCGMHQCWFPSFERTDWEKQRMKLNHSRAPSRRFGRTGGPWCRQSPSEGGSPGAPWDPVGVSVRRGWETVGDYGGKER